ncbi:MAG: DUF1549 domain-containing protein, partial [Bdellovibrionales bacterium]|nr:DUF1549 domain-containing protein [Bdellovibrionales bacterium]
MKDYLTFGRSLRILCFTSILLSLGLMYLRLNDFLLGLELVVPRLELFTGKLHPALVHFPLALLLSAILIEGYITVRDGFRGRNKRPHLVAGFCICFGALGAFVAAVSGWMNAANQEFFGSLVSVLFWHRWLGVFVAALSIFGALLYFASARLSLDSFSQRNALRFYLLSLFLVTPLLGVGAHFGGVMVHGEDYFAEVFELPNNESSLRASANLNDSSSAHVVSPVEIESLPLPVGRKVDFSKDVFPILKRSCFKCHGGGREKGKYRIDDRDSFISSGKHGPSVVPGDSGQSNVVHLIAGLIPDNVMPEKGRRLTDNEVSILRAWIDQGLPWGDGSDANFSARTTLKLAQVTIPEKTKELKNPIDRLLTPYFKKHKVTFPNTVTDRVFARRVYLDVVGLIPTPQQLDAFLASNSPSKREELVDDLLKQDAAYADYWLAYWNDLLRNDYSGPGFLNNNRKQITSWLRRALIKNTPYDRMVTSLVAPNSRSDGFLKGIVWSGDIGITEQPAIQAAQNIGQVFLGVNLKCATCHDSFTDEWTMEDTYGIANVYAKEPLEIHECEVPTGKIVQPGFLFPSLGKID